MTSLYQAAPLDESPGGWCLHTHCLLQLEKTSKHKIAGRKEESKDKGRKIKVDNSEMLVNLVANICQTVTKRQRRKVAKDGMRSAVALIRLSGENKVTALHYSDHGLE